MSADHVFTLSSVASAVDATDRRVVDVNEKFPVLIKLDRGLNDR